MIRRLQRERNKKGNQIAEFGPAVMLLVLAIVVPMVVLLYVGMGFACGWYLNFMSVRAAAASTVANLQASLDAQQAVWTATGFPAFACATVIRNSGPYNGPGGAGNYFANIRQDTITDQDLSAADPGSAGVPSYNTGARQPFEKKDVAVIETVVEITPIIQLPFVPLSPYQFTYHAERPIEEADVEADTPPAAAAS